MDQQLREGDMMAEGASFELTGRQGYVLVVAALNLVTGVSGNVHKRCRREYEAGWAGGSPGVYGPDLVRLMDALESIAPGMATSAIERADVARRESTAKRAAMRPGSVD